MSQAVATPGTGCDCPSRSIRPCVVAARGVETRYMVFRCGSSPAASLRFATRGDAAGLDPHRNTIYLVSTPLAATTQGLIDLDGQSQPVPGVATAWDIASDLLTYTFRLRQGVL